MDAHPLRRSGRVARLFLVTALGLAALPPQLVGQFRDIAGTPHDFRQDLRGALADGDAEACRHCHTPGGGAAASDPTASGVYLIYASTASGRAEAGQPSGSSLLCLSCHDGMSAEVVRRHQGGLWDDRSSHPVSVVYDPYADGKLRPTGVLKSAGLKLSGDGGELRVECTTCHDPHSNRNGDFLRMSNDRSRLCLSCHMK
jgi:predicted CXXCH cytochrome family protein